jgi:xanthine dehydrogenase iron-sulfur cluster and FAD-binding subunit A
MAPWRATCPTSPRCCAASAAPPIRSTATLGGNIANGSPIGDSMPCLLALGATLVLRRRNAKGKEETAPRASWRTSTRPQAQRAAAG